MHQWTKFVIPNATRFTLLQSAFMVAVGPLLQRHATMYLGNEVDGHGFSVGGVSAKDGAGVVQKPGAQ